MKLFNSTAIAVAALAAAPAAAQTGSATPPSTPSVAQTPVISQQPTLKISKEALKAITDLQKTVVANDFANVPAKAQAALAAAKTSEDRYAIAQLQLKAAVTAKDDAASLAAIDAIATTNYLGASQVADLYSAVGVNLYNAKKFDDAAAAFQKSANLAPQNPKPYELLGEARNSQGRAAEASAAIQKAMQLSEAAGRKPSEDVLRRALSMAYEAKAPNAIVLARQWVTNYPSPTSWRNSIAIYRNMTHPDLEGTLDLMRLMRASGALTQSTDYQLYAASAAEQGNYVEAQAAINAGLAAKHIDASTPEIRDLISGLKAKPQATEADLETALASAAGASTVIRIGDRYYGLGNYAKAAATYRAAMAKPGADPNIANMHLGMALARSGDKAGAAAAFNKVGGSLSEIAKFWLLYVQGA